MIKLSQLKELNTNDRWQSPFRLAIKKQKTSALGLVSQRSQGEGWLRLQKFTELTNGEDEKFYTVFKKPLKD